MTFDLVCFIDDVESRIRVTSDLLYDIHAKLKAAGYVNPPAAPRCRARRSTGWMPG